mgnify:CR=1 FL=1
MAEPTLQEIFGNGATQTATTITILKADLPMTSDPNNRGEQVFAAIVKKGSSYLTTANFDLNLDQSINIQTGFDSLVYRTINGLTDTFLQTQLNINFNKAQATAGVTPDDY